jgi:hypothetical protein
MTRERVQPTVRTSGHRHRQRPRIGQQRTRNQRFRSSSCHSGPVLQCPDWPRGLPCARARSATGSHPRRPADAGITSTDATAIRTHADAGSNSLPSQRHA